MADGIEARSFSGTLLHDPLTLINIPGSPIGSIRRSGKRWMRREIPTILLMVLPACPPQTTLPASEALSTGRLLPAKPDWAAGFARSLDSRERRRAQAAGRFHDDAMAGYKVRRDLPGTETTSMLSPHLAFGEIAPGPDLACDDRAAKAAIDSRRHHPFPQGTGLARFLLEPAVSQSRSCREPIFNRRFDAFPGLHDAALLAAWQQGQDRLSDRRCRHARSCGRPAGCTTACA